MKGCIYKINLKNNDNFYIGSATNISKRKYVHINDLIKNKHYNVHLQRNFNKFGIQNLSFEILESDIDKDKLISREQYYLDSLIPKLNICKIAGSRYGIKLSEDTKENIRKSLIGKKYSIERRENMSKATKGKKKKPFTLEHIKNMSLSFTGMKKKPQTKEHIDKRTKYLFGNTWNKGKQNRNTPIIQLKDGIIINKFISVKETAKFLNVTSGAIEYRLKNKLKKTGGYTYVYKKDFNTYTQKKMV